MEPASTAADAKYKGVRGWLLLLCIGLTILMPLLTINNITSGYSASRPYFGRFPGLLTITLADGVLSAALTAFSVYAGLSLWRIRPGAVSLAKFFFLAVLAYAVIAAALPFMAGLPAEANSAMIPGVIRDVVRSLIYVAVWYSYLNKSVRVKTTYGPSTP